MNPAANVLLSAFIILVLFAASLVAADHPLADAVQSQDKDAIRVLLTRKVDVNAAQGDGTTALHWAAHRNDLETANLLIHAGANVNASTDLGVTPLYLASFVGSPAIVEKLLSAGANPNMVPMTGVSPLMAAARAGSVDAVRILLAQGAQVNAKEVAQEQTALMWAVAQRHPEVVRILVASGADVQARSRSHSLLVIRGDPAQVPSRSAADTLETGGSTALLFSARYGDIDSAKLLLDAGANVNDPAADGNSALVLAAHSGHGKFAEFLLERGANPNANGAGYTALHAALLRDDLGLVKALLTHKANVNVQLEKATPIRRNSADIFLPSSSVGATPLFLAAKYAAADIMRVLAASGADPNLTTRDGTTPLIAAINANRQGRSGRANALVPEEQSFETIKALLAMNVEINAANQAGDTAMHIAVSRGVNKIVQLLAEKGARLDPRNKRGQTPLAIASGRPQLDHMADLLRKLGAKE